MKSLTPLEGARAVLAAALFVVLSSVGTAAAPSWEAVNPQIGIGKGVRLEVRLVGDSANAVGPVVIRSSRLDMGPDGMEAMTAHLRPVTSLIPNIAVFEADIIMAGRWALNISGLPAGHSAPVSGVVIFTAAERHGEAQSPANDARIERRILYYRNPMGLADTSQTPKKDWMGMDYIPVFADEANLPPGAVRIDLAKVQRIGVRTEEVMQRNVTRTIRAPGIVALDESRLAVVTAKFNGFIEELFVPITGTNVRAGSPLVRVWIESPEILQKQSDLLTALRGVTGRPDDTERAARNLRLFGVPEAVVDRLRETREPVRSIILTMPADGTIMQKPATVGMRFAAGDILFRTADLSKVWVIAQVAERDLAQIRRGQTARILLKAFDDQPREDRIAYVYPELDAATRTAQVRIELDNADGMLRIGLYAEVEIEARGSGTVVAVPESAIIDSGRRRIAFVTKGDGIFVPRDLTLGRRGNGYVEIRAGVTDGERVVVSGNFLIDAESNLRAALGVFTAPAAP